MTDKPTIDPMALMQGLLSAWNRPQPQAPTARLATAAMMAQALAAANMPSRAEVDEIAARLGRIEETLGRIERALAPVPAPRTRKPAKPKA
jgi:hypothetical protein